MKNQEGSERCCGIQGPVGHGAPCALTITSWPPPTSIQRMGAASASRLPEGSPQTVGLTQKRALLQQPAAQGSEVRGWAGPCSPGGSFLPLPAPAVCRHPLARGHIPPAMWRSPPASSHHCPVRVHLSGHISPFCKDTGHIGIGQLEYCNHSKLIASVKTRSPNKATVQCAGVRASAHLVGASSSGQPVALLMDFSPTQMIQ